MIRKYKHYVKQLLCLFTSLERWLLFVLNYLQYKQDNLFNGEVTHILKERCFVLADHKSVPIVLHHIHRFYLSSSTFMRANLSIVDLYYANDITFES